MTLHETLDAISKAVHGNPDLELALKVYAFENYVQMPVVFTDKHGLQFVLHPGQNSEVYFRNQGNYEISETCFCSRFLKAGMTAFDVGANVGFYALLFAQLVGPFGVVHTFEAEERNFRRLVTNISLNGLSNLRPNRAAVFSREGSIELNVFPDSVNSWHSLGKPTLPDPWAPGKTMTPSMTQLVPAITLDDYCLRENVTSIDLLKIDVEGAELDVLHGAREILHRGMVKAIMFEVSLPQVEALGHAPHEIFSTLKSYDYSVYNIDSTGAVTHEVSDSSNRYDNFVALSNRSDIDLSRLR